MQVILTNISYIGTSSNIQFIQESVFGLDRCECIFFRNIKLFIIFYYPISISAFQTDHPGIQ